MLVSFLYCLWLHFGRQGSVRIGRDAEQGEMYYSKAIGAITVNDTLSTLAGTTFKAYTTAQRKMHNEQVLNTHQ